jgi:hypothetical protein
LRRKFPACIFSWMKNKRKKHLTFGEFIMAAYRAWGKTDAREMVRLAVESRVVVFQGEEEFLISDSKRRTV